MKTINQTIAERIKAERIKLGLNQKDFAEKIFMQQANYSKLELGEREISIDRAYKIAEALDVPVKYLIFGENEENKIDKNCIEKVEKLEKDIEFLKSHIELQSIHIKNFSSYCDAMYWRFINMIVYGILDEIVSDILGGTGNHIFGMEQLEYIEENISYNRTKKSIAFFAKNTITWNKYYARFLNLEMNEPKDMDDFITVFEEKTSLLLEEVLVNIKKYISVFEFNSTNYFDNHLTWLFFYLCIELEEHISNKTDIVPEYELYFSRFFKKLSENQIIKDVYLQKIYNLYMQWEINKPIKK